MNKICVKNSCIMIRDYTPGDSPDLARNFQVWNPIAHRMDILGMHYNEEQKSLYITRGIDI